jgi:hypothetical protein
MAEYGQLDWSLTIFGGSGCHVPPDEADMKQT